MSRVLNVLWGIADWRRETCDACGDEFRCGATLKGCWCSELTLSAEIRADLQERFTGCLCRGCLERFANKDLEGKNQRDN